jgi:hypothetical protein
MRSNRPALHAVSPPDTMTRKNWILLGLLLLLAGGYVYRFTDWIRVPRIQVEVATRPSGRAPAGATVLPTLFLLDRECRLDLIRVIALSNVPPATVGKAVWHLVAEGKAEQQRGFEYGEALPGYKVARQPDALVPGALYRLELASGRARGARDFTAQAPVPADP